MNIVNLANKLDRGRDSGKPRSKVFSLKNELNRQMLPKHGPLATFKPGAHSLWVALINRQLSGALETIGGMFGRQPKNAEATHPILMCFSQISEVWYCSFFADPRKARRLPRRLTFRDSATLWTAAKRGNADLSSSESRRSFECDIRLGRGSLWLQLSDEQIATLSQ